MVTSAQHWRGLAIVGLLLSGCHLALGIEEGELVGSEAGGGGEASHCVKNADCDDGNVCTADSCDNTLCTNAQLDGAAPESVQTADDCKLIVCEAGAEQARNDDTDAPQDDNACTDDLCSNGSASHPPVAAKTACPDDKICDGKGQCVGCITDDECVSPATCGGAGQAGACGCTPSSCADLGYTCGTAPDGGCGVAIDCNNGSKDPGETSIDCGGPTRNNGGTCDVRCASGETCIAASDCATSVCLSNSQCQ